ncbi:MAG: NERD domain-containing protein [Desulfobacterales bacterium]|nr:MAG: NERD domain-containing protein [Desulfobacterales bacterium]
MNHFVQLIPFLGILIIYGLLYSVTKALVAYYQLKKRRSPFVGNFLRSPGESIRWQLGDLSDDVSVHLLSALVLPLIFYASILTQAYFGGQAFSVPSIWILILVAAAFETYTIHRLILSIKKRRTLRLGYEGGLAVGQELNRLLREGYDVYHDFPADHFNIDHIIVGPAGVYAVETKARQKPTTGSGRSDAKVFYDGKKLQFPDWTETKPLEQARRQAQWLSKWLSSAVGASIDVQPVITLPGWYVERTSANGFPVINPKNFRSILKSSKTKPLDTSMVTRIVHQIDQRCRDVRPRAGDGLGGKPGLLDKENA